MLAHYTLTPSQPGWLEDIDRAIEMYKPDGWKGYTIGDIILTNASRSAYRLDDEKLMFLAFCTTNGIDLNEMVESRLFADMLPFRFQIVSVAHHSLGAIEGLKKGVFTPPGQTDPLDYRALQKLVADTITGLQRLTPSDVNGLEGREVVFSFRDRQIPFTAETFVLSFSLPNFFFHATTAYDILRTKGVPLGKRDFLGQLRIKH